MKLKTLNDGKNLPNIEKNNFSFSGGYQCANEETRIKNYAIYFHCIGI